MPSLRKRHKTVDGKRVLIGIHAVFYDPDRHPKQKFVTLRTKDQAVARARLADLERKYSRGEYDPWESPAPDDGILLSEAIKRYLKDRADRALKTTRGDGSILGLLAQRCGAGFMLAHVEVRHIMAVTPEWLSDSTRHTYHTRLSTFFSWCQEQGLIQRHPMSRLKKPRVGQRTPEYLSRSQFERLITHIDTQTILVPGALEHGRITWLADVVRFAVGTGFRLSEITNLKWSAVDLHTRFVHVKNTEGFRSKNRDDRAVPFGTDVREVLVRLQEQRRSEADTFVFTGSGGERLDGTYVSKRFRKYALAAGLPKSICFHSLRHTYASWLVAEGVDLFRVQKLLGHKSISSTMIYAHLRPDDLVAAVGKVFG